MIRINKAGLSASERGSVRRPLASNDGSDLELDKLGGNLELVVGRYEDVFSLAIDNINKDRPTK